MARALCGVLVVVAGLLACLAAGGPSLERVPDDLKLLPACNNETEFDCEYAEGGLRKCIPLEWLCDNVDDCPRNLKDETMCRYLHNCEKDMLICLNGACVDADFKCNGIDDCGDGTDERGCSVKTVKTSSSTLRKCSEGTFRCVNGPCITIRAKCDHVKDCPKGEDENDCPEGDNGTLICNEHHFRCDDTCIPRMWSCDGVNDCLDGTDELEELCNTEVSEEVAVDSLPSRDDYHSHVVNQSFCSSSEFLCESGNCIPKEKLCDSKADCPRGNDEGGRCGECVSFGCSHRCTDTPDGAVCSCREGEQLSLDGRVCEDADECATPQGKVCSHRCVNVQRTFECVCFPHYQLSNDGHSCHADGDPYSSVFFSLGSEVRHMPPFSAGSSIGYGITQSNDEVGTAVRSISFSPLQNAILMAVTNADHHGFIHSSIDGVQHCVVEKVVGIANIAVDWITTNIYYTAQYPSKMSGVSVCSFDGRFCRRLVEGIDDIEYFRRQAYRGLVVNPRSGNMYWIDVPGTLGSPKIMTSSMDGSRVRALVTSKLSHPQGLAMDYLRQHLYFADIELQLIERIDVNSRERAMVTSRGVHHPYELAFFDDYVYWSDWNTEAVLAARIGSEEVPHVAHSLSQMPYGIAINHSVLWDFDVVNPCENAKCRLCVLTAEDGEVMGKCVCPNFYKEEDDGHCRALNDSEIIGRVSKHEVPNMCTEAMVAHCKAGDACLNGGACKEVFSRDGLDYESIVCDCREGFSGRYCEEGQEWAGETMLVAESAWLLSLLLLTIFLAVVIVAYIASSRCPFIERLTDRLMVVMSSMHFGSEAEDDREEIVKQTTLVYDRDGFNNPAYNSPHADPQTEPLSPSGAAPTYNTLPEPLSAPERHSPSPRFTLGGSM